MTASNTERQPLVHATAGYSDGLDEHTGLGHTILQGYIRGQILGAIRAGFWWVVLSPLVLALFNHNAIVLAAARLLFNSALLIASPYAAATVEQSSIRRFLILSTFTRVIAYALCLPTAWILTQTEWVIQILPLSADNLFLVVFLIVLTIDGVLVAFSNVVDVDCGGADLVAHQHSIKLSDYWRNKFNSIHVAAFEWSMVLLPPLFGFILLLLRGYLQNLQIQQLVLISLLGGSFLLLGLVSILFYFCYIPKVSERDIYDCASDLDVSETSSMHSATQLWSNIVEGFSLTWMNKPLFWRLIFLSVEASFEDSVISVVIAMYSLYALGTNASVEQANGQDMVPAIQSGLYDYIVAFFWTCALSSVGKLGSIFTSVLMSKFWTIPDPKGMDIDVDEAIQFEQKTFKPFFKYVMFSGISMLLFPTGWWLWTSKHRFYESQVCLFLGSFMFFACSAVPKIGFQTLFHNLARVSG